MPVQLKIDRNSISELLKQLELTEDKQSKINLFKEIIEIDPLNKDIILKYIPLLSEEGKIDEATEVFEKSVGFNSAQLELWLAFFDFTLEEIYINKQDENKARQIFERGIDAVGEHYFGVDIWLKYIEFEVMLNNMGQAAMLFHESLQSAVENSTALVDGFKQHIENFFDKVVEDLQNNEVAVSQRHKETHQQLVKHILSDCDGDKFEFIKLIGNKSEESIKASALRKPYEEMLLETGKAKQSWLDYIEFEIQQGQLRRAKLLYERALVIHNLDTGLWLSFMRFVIKKLKDQSQARGRFIQRQSYADKFEKVEIMIEEAKFEEDQGFAQKSRRIHERIQSEVAPGYAKAVIEFINFERRQNNIEKSKELYFKLYTDSLEKGHPDLAAWATSSYANFMLYRIQDKPRALEVFKNAFGKVTNSRLLYHSYLNFIRSNNMFAEEKANIQKVVRKALVHPEIPKHHKANLASTYFSIFNETSTSVLEVQEEEQWLKQHGLFEDAIDVRNKVLGAYQLSTPDRAPVSKNGGEQIQVGAKRTHADRAPAEDDELEEGEVKRQRQE